MNLQDVMKILKKWWRIILSTVFISLGISALITFFILTPQYSSSTQLIVTLPNNSQSSINLNDVNANLMMINTYKDFIQKGNTVAEQAKSELEKSIGFEGTSDDIKKMIRVSQEQNSQMFTITATATKSSDAAEIANVVAKVFQSQVTQVLTNVDKVSIISTAQITNTPVFPNKKLMLAVGVLFGLIIGMAIAMVLEMLDHTIKDSDYIEENFGLTLLGTVPQMTEKELQILSTISNEKLTVTRVVSQTSEETSQEKQDYSRRNRNRL